MDARCYDDTVKSDFDNPTIGLLLCRTKSNIKAEYSLRGVTQPLEIAEYEVVKIINEVCSTLPTVDDFESLLKCQDVDIEDK